MKLGFTAIKVMCVALCIVLLTGLPPIIWAEENVGSDPAGDSKGQIFYNPPTQISDDGLLEYRKSIEQIGYDRFTINFDIITQNKIEAVRDLPASVVLALDVSGSMLNLAPDGNTVFYHAKKAAAQFATEFLGKGESDHLLGLVGYDYLAFNALMDRHGYGERLTNDLGFFLSRLDQLEATANASSGTNIQHGIYTARTLLNNYGAANPKHVVLFSDGAANYSHQASYAEPIGNTLITPYVGASGNVYDMNFKMSQFDYYMWGSPLYSVMGYYVGRHYYPTISEGIIAKEEDDIDVYTVLFKNANLNPHEYEEAVFTMQNVATSGQYHEIDDIMGLAQLYEQLERDILHKTKLWTITDPLADYTSFDGFTTNPPPAGANYNPRNHTLTWNLMHTDLQPVQISPDRYKYSLSYYITFLSNNMGIENNKVYPSEGETTLDYFIGDSYYSGEKRQVPFDLPLIRSGSFVSDYLTVYPLDMIAYQGGRSASGNSFPRPYFSVRKDDGTVLTQDVLDSFTFYMDSNRHNPGDFEYFIYELPFRANFINKETNEVHYDPSEEYSSEDVGLYNIQLTTKDKSGHVFYVTAVDPDNTVYDFRFYQGATLEVRKQQQESLTTFTPYIEGTPPSDFRPTAPTAFVPTGTVFTNSAGIQLDPAAEKTTVVLMADTVLEENQQGIDNVIRASSLTKDMKYVTVYLNLVDHEDGNIIVQADKPVTVLCPYPPRTNKYHDFAVLHFEEVKRGVGQTPTYDPVVLSPVKMDNAIAFTVNSFSPFAIAYSTTANMPPTPSPNPTSMPYPPYPPGPPYPSNAPSTQAPGTAPSSTASPGTVIGNTNTERADIVQVPHNRIPGRHPAYMIGYPERTFKAQGNMTRAEAALMFARIGGMDLTADYSSTFRDVRPGLWYSSAIGFLQQRGIIDRVSEFFRPGDAITRAEFAALATTFDGLSGEATDVFSDVPKNHWAADEISLAVERGWIQGYGDGTFKPDRYITRAEVVTFVNHVLARRGDVLFIDSNDGIIRFTDLFKDFWAYYDIMEAVNDHNYILHEHEHEDETWTELLIPGYLGHTSNRQADAPVPQQATSMTE